VLGAFALASPDQAFGQAAGGEPDADQQRMLELINRIKEGMKAIDANLLKAGTPEDAKGADRTVESILNETRRKHRQVIKDIDELIRSVKYSQSSSSSQSNQQQQPKPQQKPQPRQENPSDEDLKQNPQQPENGQRPEDDRPANNPPQQENSAGSRKDPDPENVNHTDASGRWGLLPPKVQEDILNSNVEDLPQKYRKWLEEYYRRVSKRR
jgi:hypothetical protein